MKIAITGEKGFLGQHLTIAALHKFKYEVVELGRDYITNLNKVKDCDWVIHCAGANRGDDVKKRNISLAQDLTYNLNKLDISVNIVFISSIQEDLDNDYGISKKEAGSILNLYCNQRGTIFQSYKLPNLFGPFGKPNYNSVVATFCHNISQNIEVKVNSEAKIGLTYVQDACSKILQFKNNVEFNTNFISILELKKTLEKFKQYYKEGIIPELITQFDINLFNTYRSYTKCKHQFNRYTDDRGYLIELLKVTFGQSQIFFSTTKPGITRGNHFHFGKIERFCILKGSAKVETRKIGTSKVNTYLISEKDNTVIDMPVMYTHNITNVGKDELVCVFWTNEIFDKENPDTYYEIV